jgi:hypothetical protein
VPIPTTTRLAAALALGNRHCVRMDKDAPPSLGELVADLTTLVRREPSALSWSDVSFVEVRLGEGPIPGSSPVRRTALARSPPHRWPGLGEPVRVWRTGRAPGRRGGVVCPRRRSGFDSKDECGGESVRVGRTLHLALVRRCDPSGVHARDRAYAIPERYP